MADKDTELTNLESLRTVTDDQIVTERRLPRRSFLNRTGALLAGAAGIVSGLRASTLQQDDPDKKPADPDKKKSGDPDSKKSSDPDSKKSNDPDSRKSNDPDSKKSRDPDQKKTSDPDKTDPRKL